MAAVYERRSKGDGPVGLIEFSADDRRKIKWLIEGGFLIPMDGARRGSEAAAASNQCQGICASGKRCSNNVAPGRKKYCGIHA